ncbi:transposase [Streptomyces chrestomyceticus]|uniref:Transposase n=1 Tax=Streptomyces chrestomyceticus TaxID=68185 RepID=A0ABU7X338_9ACTN
MALSMPAQRIEQITGQIDLLNQRLTGLVERHAPQPLAPVGVGSGSAVTLLIAMGDHPERLSTEASFAALCGAGPIEYDSRGRSSRRLNRGGDRQAIPLCTASCGHGCATIRVPRRTTDAAPRRARPVVRSSGALSDSAEPATRHRGFDGGLLGGDRSSSRDGSE